MNSVQTIPPPVFSKKFQMIARWVVVVVLWLIIGSIAIGRAGIANFMELINERDGLVETNIQNLIQNQKIQQRIEALKNSPVEQIRFLKQNFGYVEQGEYVYRFQIK